MSKLIRKRSKGYKVREDPDAVSDGSIGDEIPVTTPRRRKLLGSGKIHEESIGFDEEEQRDQLTVFEKKFLLCAERGDVPTIRSLLEKHKNNPRFNINCRDAIGRSALVVAIENENMELIELLLASGINAGDALLHAISEEFVEAVEVLLHHEEKNYAPDKPYSWETVDHDMAMFTKDVTPLILAAHRDNYEIIKLLLDRGATLPMPHDVRCGCDECVRGRKEDCLRHSRSRINAYKALSSPSLICLSSTDPILTAFKLSSELGRLSSAEHEFTQEYSELRHVCQEYATALLDHTRTSYELEIMLNYDPESPLQEPGIRMSLDRLKLAIACKQKTFIAHPNVQQLLATVWYEGSPGFRRKGPLGQFVDISKIGALFPVYCMAYMVAPQSSFGQAMTRPFTKFICHSASYCFFLLLLIMASQRFEIVLMKWIGTDYLREKARLADVQERGSLPGIVETTICVYVIGFVWSEIKQLWEAGLEGYLTDMWNIMDFFTNMLYLSCIGLRFASYCIVQRELAAGLNAYQPREKWDPYDPMLISEGLFGAANIFSFLKMVHIFSVNPHLGPLQISLGRMVFDIIKFFFIYSLVLFAFACGLNQLLWYYADIDKQLCYSGPNGERNPEHPDSCFIWRRFANLFETSQSLFWASFGLVELENFELTGIKSYTRFWSLLMYGSYSVINVVVLLNLLIAMMSNSYQIISERSDVEWKFARSKLWMSYFESGSTVPPPFNVLPSVKSIRKLLGCTTKEESVEVKKKSERDYEYRMVMRCLVRRYVTTQQRKAEETGVTEDDVNEVKQAVNSFRSVLFETLRKNGMKCENDDTSGMLSRKEKIRERRLLKDFNIDLVESVMEAVLRDTRQKKKFSMVRKSTKKTKARRNWNVMVRAAKSCHNPIGTGATDKAESLEELREQVLQEKETSPLRGVKRFVHIANRVREMDRRRVYYERASASPTFEDGRRIPPPLEVDEENEVQEAAKPQTPQTSVTNRTRDTKTRPLANSSDAKSAHATPGTTNSRISESGTQTSRNQTAQKTEKKPEVTVIDMSSAASHSAQTATSPPATQLTVSRPEPSISIPPPAKTTTHPPQKTSVAGDSKHRVHPKYQTPEIIPDGGSPKKSKSLKTEREIRPSETQMSSLQVTSGERRRVSVPSLSTKSGWI